VASLVFALAVLGIGVYSGQLHRRPKVGTPRSGLHLRGVGRHCVASRPCHPPPTEISSSEEMLLPLTERLDQLAILLNLMSEQQLLSDRAISIAYREKDRDALRRAVHEGKWAATIGTPALSLVDEMERAFGNKAESTRLRKEINDHRQDLVRKQNCRGCHGHR